jgi:hypothetical protein
MTSSILLLSCRQGEDLVLHADLLYAAHSARDQRAARCVLRALLSRGVRHWCVWLGGCVCRVSRVAGVGAGGCFGG